MKEIPDCAFYAVEFTGELNIPENITKIGNGAFRESSFVDDNLVIPEGVEIIDNGAFAESTGFNGKLVLPNSLKKIGDEAFHNTAILTGILELPENLEILGAYAFTHCSQFNNENIIIPKKSCKIRRKWTGSYLQICFNFLA